MKEKIKKFYPILISIGFLIPILSFAQTADEINEEALINKMATLNLGYLGVCVTIILFAGGLIALFNLNPLIKRIEKHEDEIEKTKGDFKSLIEKEKGDFEILEQNIIFMQTDTTDRIEERYSELKKTIETGLNSEIKKSEEIIKNLKQDVDKKMFNFENKFQNLHLNTLFNEHFMWQIAKVPENDLRALIECIETGIEYKRTGLFKLSFQEIVRTLGLINPKDYELNFHSGLIKVLQKIEGFEQEKKEIFNKINELMKNTESRKD